MPIKFDSFSGIVPRLPDTQLPPIAASRAQNCEFAYRELRNTKGDYLVQTLANAPVSIYTDDGLLFYSWTSDVNAARSPLSRDTFDRLYYTTVSDFRVTSRSGMRTNGGEPASSYRVGVPRPTVAPVLTVQTVPTLTSATVTAKFHYEYSGVKYQEQDIVLTSVTANEKWSFTPPTLTPLPVGGTGSGGGSAGSTPPEAFPVIRLTAKDNDTHEVIFDAYTDNSSFVKKSVVALSLAKNDGAATYSVTLASGVLEEDRETRAYVYTYVNTYNEEGPPSPPTQINATPTLDVNCVATRDPQTSDYAPIKEIRWYRTPTGSEIADYFFTGSVTVLTNPSSTSTFVDNVKASGLNEPISSTNYYPPDPALVGLMSLPNGILCAWKGNELHFSDAYKPWSWPPQYVMTFPAAIVGGIAHGAGALITTALLPYFVSGVSPGAMTESKVKVPQAGVSKWSVIDIGGQIVYASNDGLVMIDGGQGSLRASEQFFTRDVWRAKYGTGLSSMRFAVWDGRLIVYSSNNAFTPFLIRLDEAAGTMTELPHFVAKCSFVSPLSDQCYFTSGTGLFQFAGGTDVSALWQSREIELDMPINFGAAEVVCSGSWEIRFYSNDDNNDLVLRHTKAVAGREQFRLPGGFKSDRWQVRVSGIGSFKELRIAETLRGLRAV